MRLYVNNQLTENPLEVHRGRLITHALTYAKAGQFRPPFLTRAEIGGRPSAGEKIETVFDEEWTNLY